MRLLDLNVCLYAVNAESARHKAAVQYLDAALNSDEAVGFAWVVILGFLRVGTHPRVFPRPLTAQQAMSIVDGWLGAPLARLIHPGPEHWRLLKELFEETGTAANLTTDCHLAALALENGARLISFDADFSRFPRLSWETPG